MREGGVRVLLGSSGGITPGERKDGDCHKAVTQTAGGGRKGMMGGR